MPELKDPKKEKFCQEYAAHGYKARALRAAGYADSTAKSYPNYLDKNKDIQRRISELRKEYDTKGIMEKEAVLQALTDVANGEMISQEIAVVETMVDPTGALLKDKVKTAVLVNKKPSQKERNEALKALGQHYHLFDREDGHDMSVNIVFKDFPDKKDTQGGSCLHLSFPGDPAGGVNASGGENPDKDEADG